MTDGQQFAGTQIDRGDPQHPDIAPIGAGRIPFTYEGPTLRDQFAMAALTGLCQSQMSKEDMIAISDGTKGGKYFAGCAYRLADKMLKERQDKSDS